MKTFNDINKLLKKASKRDLKMILELCFDEVSNDSKNMSYSKIINRIEEVYKEDDLEYSNSINERISRILN